ncbi:MAG: hypothetical protein A2600_11295 [Candidatus Lambdaproteobacteria bacterium RIFOXYD1_FULL_56_27]|uniref:Lipoprotein n=1 Tax=Candidatus Lambdaproteobacteria bacterium RIFOXYD2_FULL_56_26 TaxID=1817773 RepID=A0A1F6GZR5_9PROT|nr:MAG: hypothetical protein A2426_08430 [Candidatus Lambdaproteobacteria bacterium RIFOXYC1_FULL_56_13]OGH03541.1 MAG: hypothetical protein A2557_01150 [Candidatus Lambdaproteobacteria bacterium RIFOXYD2_FULL_56_26]OGH07673.1 MAG: hypothetical protein A2600_11295 [Candidatus Lambdaproteobacteria bacterium RIFOXYD1_FULL_56_27]
MNLYSQNQGMKKPLLILMVVALLAGCSSIASEDQLPPKPPAFACAEPRLESAFRFHEKSKDFLKAYYTTRKESDLYFSWYASEDSLYMARTIGKCWDKRNKHFHAAQNVFQKNGVLRNLIVQNMRTDSQSAISELFLEDYRKIFVRDIQ